MSWYKKSQNLYNFQIAVAEEILKRHLDGPVEDVATDFVSQGIQNPCGILEMLCTAPGRIVPPFYMTVWSALCGGVQQEQPHQAIQEPYENDLAMDQQTNQ